MTRSTGGKPLNMRLVTAAAGIAAVLATSVLAGCSAGQAAATSKITAAVPGGSTTVMVPAASDVNSSILVENATVDYHDTTGYAKGKSAALTIRIINQTPFPVTVKPGGAYLVTGGESALIGDLRWTDGSKAVPVPAAAVTPSAPSSSKGPKVAPSTAGSPTPSESATPTPPSAPTFADLIIPPGAMLVLSRAAGQYLEIGDLTAPIGAGDVAIIRLAFTADGKPYAASVAVPFDPPASPAPRQTIGG